MSSQVVVRVLVLLLILAAAGLIDSAFQGATAKASYGANIKNVLATVGGGGGGGGAATFAKQSAPTRFAKQQSTMSVERLHSAYPSAAIEEEALNLGDEETITDDAALETISPKAVAKLAAIAPPAVTARMSNASEVAECSNDSLKQDFGTACLKKSINASLAPTAAAAAAAAAVATSSLPKSRKPGQTSAAAASAAAAAAVTATPNSAVINNNANTIESGKSRYFSVKPMVHNKKIGAPNGLKTGGFKSPGMQARQLYDSKGYDYALKGSAKGYYANNNNNNNNNNNRLLSPSKFYSSRPNFAAQESEPGLSRVDGGFKIQQQQQQTTAEEEEWNGLENMVPTQEVAPKPSPSMSAPGGNYQEEYEMLTSLKKSLGILSAQATNLKQRAVILYQEARRRRLYFFDALLSRTYKFMNEKQDETRNAIIDIENTIEQIEQHQHGSGWASLRKLRYYLGDDGSAKRMKKQNLVAPIDRKEIDRLIEDVLKHAQRMMLIIKELNEALDEFEEQFNMPRYEPNNIELFADPKEDF